MSPFTERPLPLIKPLETLHPLAVELFAYGVQSLDAAKYWMDLGQEDCAIQCHQTAAQYFSAAMLAEAVSL